MKQQWIVMGLVMLAGCGGKPAPDLYVLRAGDEGMPCKPLSRSIAVMRPDAMTEYDTRRMAILLGKNHLTYYTGASWASPFPDQLQDFLKDRFTAAGLQVAEENDAHGANMVRLTIREAYVTNIDAPVVHLRLNGMIGGRHFSNTQIVAATENHMPEIVDAYSKAASQAADEMLKRLNARCH